MGVDYTGHGPLYAMGSGTITNVENAGWPGGKFIGLHLDTGQYMYYAENIIPHVHKGQRVTAGQLVGTAVGTYPFVEVGWAAAPGTGQTLAAAKGQAATGGDPGAHATAYGVNMSNLIKSLGGPPGITSGPITGSVSGSDALPKVGDVSTTGALSGCVPLIYYVWVVYIAARNTSYRFRRHPAKCGYRVSPDKDDGQT
jgi:hypothetical protein